MNCRSYFRRKPGYCIPAHVLSPGYQLKVWQVGIKAVTILKPNAVAGWNRPPVAFPFVPVVVYPFANRYADMLVWVPLVIKSYGNNTVFTFGVGRCMAWLKHASLQPIVKCCRHWLALIGRYITWLNLGIFFALLNKRRWYY
jgi:hypothetical protein